MVFEEIVEDGGEAGAGDGEELAFGGADAVGEGLIETVGVGTRAELELSRCFGKVAAVMDEFPAAGETPDAAQGLKAHGVRAQQLVRRLGAEDEAKRFCVAGEACAREAFEEVDLEFGRSAFIDQCVEAAGEGCLVLAGQSENEVRMDDRAGLAGEEAQVGERGGGVEVDAEDVRKLGFVDLGGDALGERVDDAGG